MPPALKPNRPTADSSYPLLSVQDLSVTFGGIHALQGVSFDVELGAIVGLIGPNGAGKTTLFNCLSRLYEPSGGVILFAGKSLLSLKRHEIAGAGLGRTFQNVSLFNDMSVLDNILVGGHASLRKGYLASILKLKGARREEVLLRERAHELVALMNLQQYAGSFAGELPFPIRKRVELARALMTKPKLLLLDEPAAGLNHEEVDHLKQQMRSIMSYDKLTILLVEHHMNLVMAVSDKVVAIDFGKKIAVGTPEQVQNDPAVIEAYLGTSDS